MRDEGDGEERGGGGGVGGGGGEVRRDMGRKGDRVIKESVKERWGWEGGEWVHGRGRGRSVWRSRGNRKK